MTDLFLAKTCAAEGWWRSMRRLNGYIATARAEIVKRRRIHTEYNVAWLEANIAKWEGFKAGYTQQFLARNS
tara:strand:+ start:516 stop:731 length:216 start_codon:yes stop_codon:yes gene_type:complete